MFLVQRDTALLGVIMVTKCKNCQRRRKTKTLGYTCTAMNLTDDSVKPNGFTWDCPDYVPNAVFQ
jgi:hypothetical protein